LQTLFVSPVVWGIASLLAFVPVAFAVQSACSLPLYRLCIESPTLDLTQECEANGGVMGLSCSLEQRVGSCAKRQAEHAVYLRYYQGVTFDPVSNCKDNGGVYTPD
jgi:hypothetical protein